VKNRWFVWLLFAILSVSLAACGTPRKSAFSPRAKFGATHESYLNLLRWREFRSAAVYYTEPRREKYLSKVQDVEEFQVTEAELVKTDYLEETREMDTEVVVKYYLLSSPRVRSLELKQRWAYFPGSGFESGQWFITTPFTGFPVDSDSP